MYSSSASVRVPISQLRYKDRSEGGIDKGWKARAPPLGYCDRVNPEFTEGSPVDNRDRKWQARFGFESTLRARSALIVSAESRAVLTISFCLGLRGLRR